jgi:TolB protein
VYVENIETGEVRLVAPNAVDPTWSPDGSLLAVSRMDERGQVDIWIVDVHGNNLRRVTDTPELDRYPLWLQRER